MPGEHTTCKAHQIGQLNPPLRPAAHHQRERGPLVPALPCLDGEKANEHGNEKDGPGVGHFFGATVTRALGLLPAASLSAIPAGVDVTSTLATSGMAATRATTADCLCATADQPIATRVMIAVVMSATAPSGRYPLATAVVSRYGMKMRSIPRT